MKITNYFSQSQIQWLIIHSVTMQKIIERKTSYCSLLHDNIEKQHRVHLEHKEAVAEAKQQQPREAV